MDIILLVIILIMLAIVSAVLHDNYANLCRFGFLIIMLSIIWISLSISLNTTKETLLRKVPVHFQDKIAFSTYENNLINCSDIFKIQFNPDDSICVFQKEDTWTLGIKYQGGDLVYKNNKNGL